MWHDIQSLKHVDLVVPGPVTPDVKAVRAEHAHLAGHPRIKKCAGRMWIDETLIRQININNSQTRLKWIRLHITISWL